MEQDIATSPSTRLPVLPAESADTWSPSVAYPLDAKQNKVGLTMWPIKCEPSQAFLFSALRSIMKVLRVPPSALEEIVKTIEAKSMADSAAIYGKTSLNLLVCAMP